MVTFTDMLVKFPPDTVKMKKPIHLQPWDSSPELVKKLFKVLFMNQLGLGRSDFLNECMHACLTVSIRTWDSGLYSLKESSL